MNKLPAGKYYIGDPCYVFENQNNWQKICDMIRNLHRDGDYFTYRNQKMFISSTSWGDGCYRDNEGHKYPVDAGLIGAIPSDLCEAVGNGYYKTFTKPFSCHTSVKKNGNTIRIGDIRIRT
jgi:hypothetical protein